MFATTVERQGCAPPSKPCGPRRLKLLHAVSVFLRSLHHMVNVSWGVFDLLCSSKKTSICCRAKYCESYTFMWLNHQTHSSGALDIEAETRTLLSARSSLSKKDVQNKNMCSDSGNHENRTSREIKVDFPTGAFGVCPSRPPPPTPAGTHPHDSQNKVFPSCPAWLSTLGIATAPG